MERAEIARPEIACATVPGWIAPYPPDAFDYRALLQSPSAAHPFGTDNFGRDILSRTIWAARIDLQIRRVAEGSAKVADRLRREALYYVAISAPVAPQVQAVQRAYRLAALNSGAATVADE